MNDEYTCPHCGVDLRGDEIPKEHRLIYNNRTHFNRRISVSNGDSVYEYQCPDCSGTWPRIDKPTGGFRTSPVIVK